MRNLGDDLVEMQSDTWQVRIGQIETVLSYFGEVCSVSLDRADWCDRLCPGAASGRRP